MGKLNPPGYQQLLALRRERLSEFVRFKLDSFKKPQADHARIHLEARAYPVLSILAPAMTTSENKIEFPGDPMCLYNALAYPIRQVVLTQEAIRRDPSKFPSEKVGPYNDLCPAWFDLPTADYRILVGQNPDAKYAFSAGQPINTDQYVFDPRVWNDDVKARLSGLIEFLEPRVVLVSSVSPAHRYAIEMAKLVKSVNPGILVVLGGRHADETIIKKGGTVQYAPSSIITAIQNKRIEPVVDFVLSGEGYYTLDFLMKCISVSMDIETKRATKEGVVAALEQNMRELMVLPGSGLITYVESDLRPFSYSVNGRRIDLSELPLPYEPFAIRAHFPIFPSKDGKAKSTTAHVNTANACPFRCHFCSESVGVVGKIVSTRDRAHYEKMIRTYISYGADAFFFDDSVLCAGDAKRISLLTEAMLDVRKDARSQLEKTPTGHPDRARLERMAGFEWGAQFTVDYLVTLNNPFRSLEMLKKLRENGCTYLYIGIESLAEQVAGMIDKNKTGGGESWITKTRLALMLAKEAGIRVGASVLFGLPGETFDTLNYTIEEVGKMVDAGLLFIVSPNIATYHPATPLTRLDGMESQIDYISPDIQTIPPYSFFEEAFPGVVSRRLSEEMIWHIHRNSAERWNASRNMNPMEVGQLPGIRSALDESALDLPTSPRAQFYSDDGLRLIDSANYPLPIASFLDGEKGIAENLVRQNNYRVLVEVGAMDRGFFLDEAISSGASYFGIDLVENAVKKLQGKITASHADRPFPPGVRAEAHAGDVFDLPLLAEKLQIPNEGAVAAFPFNSFGNIPYPAGVVSKVAEAGFDIAVFTYRTDDAATAVRQEYYNRCNYKNMIMKQTSQGVLFRSDDGLWSYAYGHDFVESIFAQSGFGFSAIPFGEIGMAYVGKLEN